MATNYELLVLTVLLLWSVCQCDQASPEFGRMRPGFNPDFHHGRPGSAGTHGTDIVHEHEARHEVSNNGPHQTPEFLHHHDNNHREIIHPNPTVRLQAFIPATPQIRINPTPTAVNLTQGGGSHGGIRQAHTPPPPRNLSNPDLPEMVIPTEERNEISPGISEAGQGINIVPEIKSSSGVLALASSTAHLQPSSVSFPSRTASSVSVQGSSSLGLDLPQNPQSWSSPVSSHLEASESSLDRLEATSSSIMTPRLLDSKSPTAESSCGLLCLMIRNPVTEILDISSTTVKIQSSKMDQVASRSISPTRTVIGSLPTDATGLVINNGRAGLTSQSTSLAQTSSTQSSTPLTLQTVKTPNTTAQRSVVSTASMLFSEILLPMTEQTTIATTLKRLPISFPNSEPSTTNVPETLIPLTERTTIATTLKQRPITFPNSEPSTASTNVPETLIPLTERTTIATTLKQHPITLPNSDPTTTSTPRTDFPEILIPLTEGTSSRPSSTISTAVMTTTSVTATSTTSQRPTQRETTSTSPTTDVRSTAPLSTTTQTVPSTKRSKYIPKGQRTFIFVSQTTPLPSTAPPSSTTASQAQLQTHHNGSRRRTTLLPQTTQRTTVQMGFIGSTTKAPISSTQDIKLMTFPTIQPTNQTTIIKTDANTTTQSPRSLTRDNGSRRRTTAARSSVSSTAATPGLNTTAATPPSQVNTTSLEGPSPSSMVPTVLTPETHGPAYHVSNATTTPSIQIITRAEETIPPVFLTVRLRMSWNTFCVNVRAFQHELVEILEENYQNSFKEEQIMIMNEEIKFCVEFQVVKDTDIFVKLYIVDFDGEYDSSLTVECAQFIETGFQDESFFKDKILVRRRYRKTRILNSVTSRRRFSMASNDTIALASIKARPNSGLFNPALDILDITRFINHNGILSNPVNFAGLVNICQDVELIYEEFYAIKNDMPRLSTVPKGAEDKNRYSNVIPTPKTRVNLKRKVSQVNSEYINANFITGYPEENKAFIATQAPLRNTRDDFWRMVWEQQSRVIVMLNAMDEPGKSKCDDYLPESPDNIVKYGDFTVVLKKKDVTQEYILSTLELKDIENNLIREIKHVWYTSWSNKNRPDPVSLVKFVIEVRQLYEDSGGPLVVHCSPGTGRTGTMLTVDICTRQYDAEKLVDVLKCVCKMRKERAGVVQTKEQYALIYQALYEYALFVNSPPISAASSVMTLHQVRL